MNTAPLSYDFTTHKLAHRDGEKVARWNPELKRREYWSALFAEWREEPPYTMVADRAVSWYETWAEKVAL